MHRPQVPESGRIRYRHKTRTRWSDEDNQNVLNNAVYLTLLEESRHGYFDRLGMLEQNHFPFLLYQTNVRYVAPGRGAADVEIEVVTTHLGTRSFQQSYRVREAHAGTVWCEAEAVLVTFDPATGKSAAMSPGFKQAIAEFEGLG
jgi:YbgC/YbaW family acyl-CoA thioester hydrolase